jgi:hypothetical protein
MHISQKGGCILALSTSIDDCSSLSFLGAFLVSFLALALVTVGFLPIGIGRHYDHPVFSMECDIKSVYSLSDATEAIRNILPSYPKPLNRKN